MWNPGPAAASESGPAFRLKLALAFFAIFVVWGTTYLAIRYAVATIPPFAAAAIRHTTAGSVLLAFAWSRGFRPARAHWAGGAALGALFFLAGHGSLHWAEQYVDSGLAALLIASEPVWILVIGAALGRQRINGWNGAGLLLGLVGVALLSAPTLGARGTAAWAIGAVLAGTVAWALGVCLSPRLPLPEQAMGRAALPMLCGGLMLALVAAGTGEWGRLHASAVALKSWLGLAYLIGLGSILTFWAYTWLLQRVAPTLVATHSYVNPLVAVLAGWLWAGEPLDLRVLAAAAAIIAAVGLVQRGERVT